MQKCKPGLLSVALLSLMSAGLMTGCEKPATEVAATPAASVQAPAPIKVKFVVITMFEIGDDSGDKAGEFQLWKERQKLDTQFEILITIST
jgi:purine nucleoside permease